MPDPKTDDLSAAFEDVEIFRVGDYGQKGVFRQADLDGMVDRYNPNHSEAPVTIDHDNWGPAYGWVKSITRRGNSLWAHLHQMSTEFAEAVKSGAFKHRSVEILHDPFRLRAVSFLGAASPHVKGMRQIKFSDDMAGDDAFHIDLVDDEEPTQFQDGYPQEVFAFTPDPKNPSGWSVRMSDDIGKPATRVQLDLIAKGFSAVGHIGRRAVVPSKFVAEVKAKILAAYHSLDVPENEIPVAVKMSGSVVHIAGQSFPRAAFALAVDENDPATWHLRTHEDADSGPTKKLLGRAVAHFTPGGFGESHVKMSDLTTDDDLARFAAAQIVADYEAIGEEVPEWIEKAVTAGQAFNMSELDLETLERARPDIVQAIQAQHEEIIMSDKADALQADLDTAKQEATQFKTDLDEATGKVDELTAKVDAFEAEKAKADMSEKIETAIASAKLPDDAKKHLREQFADATTDDGLKKAIANITFGAGLPSDSVGDVNGMGDGEGTPDLNDRAQLADAATALSKEDGISYTEALRKVASKKKDT